MKSEKQYFSLVTDRINELKRELDNINTKLKTLNKNSKLKESYTLESEFLANKIAYLENIKDLPLYMTIKNMPNEDLNQDLNNNNNSYLVKLFNLNNLESFLQNKRIVKMHEIKNTFIDDYNFISTILRLQKKNIEMTNKKESLFRKGLFGFTSLTELSYSEIKLNNHEEKIKEKINRIKNDYNINTLKEIQLYLKNPDKKLSHEFILKHKDKLIEFNPDMEKTIKKLGKKSPLNFITKLLPLKRNYKEKELLNNLVEAYKNDTNLQSIGLETIDLSNIKKYELNKFTKKLQKQITLKENEISSAKSKIKESKLITFKEVKKCDNNKKNLFSLFTTLIKSKSNYAPKKALEQMWNEPDLKESLIQQACYNEERELVSILQKTLNPDIILNLTELKEETLEDRNTRVLAA